MKPYAETIWNRALSQRAVSAVQAAHPRKSNITSGEARPQPVDLGAYSEEVFWYRGRYSNYSGVKFVPLYTSVLRVRDKYRAEYACGFTGEMRVQKIKAPKGTEWDLNGSLVLSHDYSVEYHPAYEDLLARDFAGRVRAGLRRSRQRRDEMRLEWERMERIRAEAQAKAEAEEMETWRRLADVTVGVGDALEAKLCAGGIATWRGINRLLDIDWLPAQALFMLEPKTLTRRACLMALRRHERITRYGAEIFYPHK